MDVLLTLSRGLADVGSDVPLRLTRKLLAAPNGYLLVLFSGAAGRERRARELAGMSEASRTVSARRKHERSYDRTWRQPVAPVSAYA